MSPRGCQRSIRRSTPIDSFGSTVPINKCFHCPSPRQAGAAGSAVYPVPLGLTRSAWSRFHFLPASPLSKDWFYQVSVGATPTPQRTPESRPVGEMNSLTSSKWRSLRFRFGPFRLAWRHHAPRAARASTDFAKSSGLSKGLFGYPHTCDICQQVLHKSVKPSPTFSPALFLVILPSRCSDLGSRDLGLGCPARFRCT